MAAYYNTFPSTISVYSNTRNSSAISVQQVSVSFGIGNTKRQILNDVSINIDQGTIFGLLGPSGCGKTTLLKCIIARVKPDQGSIKVFDQIPGTVASKIPGSGVGYMPQELAVYPELFIAEILSYFGHLYGIKIELIKERMEFLFKFLNLPRRKVLIGNLSSGQKRRISLAIALMHQPPLLILDEPTVGVDPILRKNIWSYLVKLASTENVSIVITTHYIEEAREAHKIAFMRDGRILAEDKPNILLDYHNLSTLEDVFLKLCEEKEILSNNKVEANNVTGAKQHSKKQSSAIQTQGNYDQSTDSKNKQQIHPKHNKQSRFSTLKRIRALSILSFVRLWRNKILFFAQFLNPTFQMFLYCLMIGDGPKHLTVAICNQDNILGAEYLNYIDNETIQQMAVQSQKEGEDLVQQGEAWAVVTIWPNFTKSLGQRFLLSGQGKASNELIQASTIHVRHDNSDQMIYYTLEATLLEAFHQLANHSIHEINKFIKLPPSPIKFGKPIYGKEKPKAMNSFLPGILTFIIFCTALSLNAIHFVRDKYSGLSERIYVSGVTTLEIICGSICTQLFVISIQISIILIIAIKIFEIENEGSIFWLVFITIWQGLNGMTNGFLISALANDVPTAVQISMMLSMPLILSSGSIWPIEAMPKSLQIISQFQPLTVPLTGASWIFTRGKDITFFLVWRGFLASIAWSIVFVILSVIVMHIKQF